MNLLENIEGRSGEELTTAVLHFLILRSQDIREKLIDAISNASRIGPVTVQNHFSCQLELSTDNPLRGRGRVDLLIETDDTVVGLENKLFAGFQADQPVKYLHDLQQRAMKLRDLRGGTLKYLLVVLAPENRKKEVDLSPPEIAFLSWEELLKAVNSDERRLDPSTHMMLVSLVEYVNLKTNALSHFVKHFPHYRSRFKKGDPLQRELVRKLMDYLPPRLGRMNVGMTWMGYYFLYGGHKGWFGFVAKSELKEEIPNESEMIICATCDLTLPVSHFRTIHMKNDEWFGGGPFYAWSVQFDRTWTTDSIWRERLVAPLTTPLCH